MGTIWVKEFTGGLDTRRLPVTTTAGVLIKANNGHINRGGEENTYFGEDFASSGYRFTPALKKQYPKYFK